MPFTRAIEGQMESWGNNNCAGDVGDRDGRAASIPSASGCNSGRSCRPRPTPRATAPSSTTMPPSSSASAVSIGRRAHALRDVKEWLVYRHAVSDEVRILVLVVVQFSVRVPAQRHGTDAGQDHGPRRRHRRAPRPGRQSRRDLRPMPDRGRRGRAWRAVCWASRSRRSASSACAAARRRASPGSRISV